MERLRYRRAFTDVLKQCRETTKNYECSEETLKHILQEEEILKRLLTELNWQKGF
ncbi:hypothetical protein MUO98_00080 [Candidatus Bathyarchaeota archaeon]|nr:hypothetical protein [Candidatus Bathyarchaeota archaeon]